MKTGIATKLLLRAWEENTECSPLDKAVAIASVAAGSSEDAVAYLSTGDRDRHLLLLRKQLFGPQITFVAACPGCAGKVEAALSVDRLIALPRGEVADSVSFGEHLIHYRAPTSADLRYINGYPIRDARRELLRRCCSISSATGNSVVETDTLPDSLAEAVEAAMENADPLAEINVALCCPDCGTEWNDLFDIGSFLWQELDLWARSLLQEVHVLASAYGWSEATILTMSRRRRQTYMEMIGI